MQTLFYILLNISANYHQNRSLQFRAIPFQSWCIFSETQKSRVTAKCTFNSRRIHFSELYFKIHVAYLLKVDT